MLAGLLLLPLLLAACGGGDWGSDQPPPTAGFSIEVTPASALAFAGSGRLLTVTLARSGGFTADVTVALSNPPAGVTAETLVFSDTIATPTLPVTLDDDVAAGNLRLALNASSGALSVGATAQLSVQAAQIANALAANSIDRDTALLYRLYALHGDPRLPEASRRPFARRGLASLGNRSPARARRDQQGAESPWSRTGGPSPGLRAGAPRSPSA